MAVLHEEHGLHKSALVHQQLQSQCQVALPNSNECNKKLTPKAVETSLPTRSLLVRICRQATVQQTCSSSWNTRAVRKIASLIFYLSLSLSLRFKMADGGNVNKHTRGKAQEKENTLSLSNIKCSRLHAFGVLPRLHSLFLLISLLLTLLLAVTIYTYVEILHAKCGICITK